MKSEGLRGTELKELFKFGCQLLTVKQEEINILNVFPVPDGDTGTNMALTFQAAVDQAESCTDNSLAKITKELAQGALMGARGNSGVILSQLLRGFALSLTDKTELQSMDLAQALQSGVDTAYLGVKKPVEGTILTVAKMGALGAVKAARAGANIVEVLEATCLSARQALNNTPEQLPILKQVGVVDAGGMGWLVILEGFLQAARGEQLEGSLAYQEAGLESGLESEQLPIDNSESLVLPTNMDDINFQYCTEFILKGVMLNKAILSIALEPLGDSLLVVGDAAQLKIHIHSNNPGTVLETCLPYGSLHQIHINNMLEQARQFRSDSRKNSGAEMLKPIGIVAVSSGEGLNNILSSLGVDHVVEGGQTNNPSTQDLVNAITKVPAERVLLLPNNSNVIFAAQQASELADKPVDIIPTKSIPQGIAALVAFEPESSLEANIEKMFAAANNVITVEITYAVRDSMWEDKSITKNAILGLIEDKIAEVGQDIPTVVNQVIAQALTPEHGLITLFYGEGVQAEEAELLQAELSTNYPDVEFEVHAGGQYLYYYLISIEP